MGGIQFKNINTVLKENSSINIRIHINTMKIVKKKTTIFHSPQKSQREKWKKAIEVKAENRKIIKPISQKY